VDFEHWRDIVGQHRDADQVMRSRICPERSVKSDHGARRPRFDKVRARQLRHTIVVLDRGSAFQLRGVRVPERRGGSQEHCFGKKAEVSVDQKAPRIVPCFPCKCSSEARSGLL
jgi:hypothetical protein